MVKRVDKSARVRWTILLLAAGVTAAASFYPTDDTSLIEPVRPKKRTAPPAPTTTAAVVASATLATDATEPLDPFAPRGWQAPPPPPPPAPPKPIQVVAAPVVQAPVGPPPLPFKFMGAMNDDGAQVIYLSRGDQALIARNGETLEGTYKVLAIDSQHIEFEHLPTGEKQTLPLPASDN